MSYREKLTGVCGIEAADEAALADKPMADYNETAGLLSELKAAMEEMDIDRADEIMTELKQYRYPDEVMDTIDNLGAAVSDLDEDLVGELSDQITDKGEWK
ncbi:MAG: hypothetical protein J6N76_03245, partial [Lachnospiraceae bacterium]|nr:hypothetical protein [Lachnospiraceae bacterium]